MLPQASASYGYDEAAHGMCDLLPLAAVQSLQLHWMPAALLSAAAVGANQPDQPTLAKDMTLAHQSHRLGISC